MSIVIITSEFNSDITKRLYQGAYYTFITKGISEDNILSLTVPGAVELPITAKKVIKKTNPDAVIVLGAVIRGDTSHYDYVCQMVSQGIMQVSLETECPIIFGVLTTENEEQAYARVGGEAGHKGIEAANTALDMIKLMKTF